jgi:hypothetical protein
MRDHRRVIPASGTKSDARAPQKKVANGYNALFHQCAAVLALEISSKNEKTCVILFTDHVEANS